MVIGDGQHKAPDELVEYGPWQGLKIKAEGPHAW